MQFYIYCINLSAELNFSTEICLLAIDTFRQVNGLYNILYVNQLSNTIVTQNAQ